MLLATSYHQSIAHLHIVSYKTSQLKYLKKKLAENTLFLKQATQ